MTEDQWQDQLQTPPPSSPQADDTSDAEEEEVAPVATQLESVGTPEVLRDAHAATELYSSREKSPQHEKAKATPSPASILAKDAARRHSLEPAGSQDLSEHERGYLSSARESPLGIVQSRADPKSNLERSQEVVLRFRAQSSASDQSPLLAPPTELTSPTQAISYRNKNVHANSQSELRMPIPSSPRLTTQDIHSNNVLEVHTELADQPPLPFTLFSPDRAFIDHVLDDLDQILDPPALTQHEQQDTRVVHSPGSPSGTSQLSTPSASFELCDGRESTSASPAGLGGLPLTPAWSTSKRPRVSSIKLEDMEDEPTPSERSLKGRRLSNEVTDRSTKRARPQVLFDEGVARAMWQPSSFRHEGCDQAVNSVCSKYEGHARASWDEFEAPLAAKRVLSGRSFDPADASEAHVRYILKKCPCDFIQSFDEAWENWRFGSSVECSKERFVSCFYADKLNEAVQRFCLYQIEETEDLKMVIVIDD